ncbi:MAG: ArsR family transcriptional regulator [Pseudohongiellaceae bacterium]|jgi:DNA-binding transcriptional ArsR family regulator/SAM-dependent methyltransferase
MFNSSLSISIYIDIDLKSPPQTDRVLNFIDLERKSLANPASVKHISELPTRSEHCETEQSLPLYKALADGLRLQILRLLKKESFGVSELCKILDTRQSALSHHLKILANANLVSTRREGNSIFYRRAFIAEEDAFKEIKKGAFDDMDKTELVSVHQDRVHQIQLERSQLSVNFFNKNAHQLREQQGLIVKHDDYAGSLHDVISSIGLAHDSNVMEVGPGEGRLLLELAQKYQNLTGLDNSVDMLERSRQTLINANAQGVNLILGDTAQAKNLEPKYDFIIFDMVLHHIPSPAETFVDCSQLLNSDGYLLIADLSTHDQDWVRESCGDLWLGFDGNDLVTWANKAGLTGGESAFLGLRNGFQIQIRVFRKGTSVNN